MGTVCSRNADDANFRIAARSSYSAGSESPTVPDMSHEDVLTRRRSAETITPENVLREPYNGAIHREPPARSVEPQKRRSGGAGGSFLFASLFDSSRSVTSL